MRKLLINSTAIATIAALTASVALAVDVNITATSEMKYKSRTSEVAATNGTTTVTDSEVVFSFTNKTDEGYTVGYVAELTTGGTGTDGTMDESSLSIGGGFGTVILGENDGAGDRFGTTAMDLIAEESTDRVASARINTNADLTSGNSDGTKIVYLLPPMGNLKAGISQADSGATSGSDTTSAGFSYAMDAGGSSITFGGATTTTGSSTTKDTTSNNVGIKFVSGAIKITAAQATFDAVDEDRKANDVAISYKLENGVTLGAYMVSSSDSDDDGEAYDAAGLEAQYDIATGLTAVVNINDYDYKVGNNADSDMSAVSDKGTSTTLTIKAKF